MRQLEVENRVELVGRRPVELLLEEDVVVPEVAVAQNRLRTWKRVRSGKDATLKDIPKSR